MVDTRRSPVDEYAKGKGNSITRLRAKLHVSGRNNGRSLGEREREREKKIVALHNVGRSRL